MNRPSSNHQSELDVATVTAIWPEDCVIMGKSDIKYIPIFGQYMILAKNVLINRGNRSSAMETMGAVAKTMKQEKVGVSNFDFSVRS
jgi:1-acyl-sn-glycerol-3-phosphate acyltransferase